MSEKVKVCENQVFAKYIFQNKIDVIGIKNLAKDIHK